MFNILYNTYIWYYYNIVNCCYCGNKLYIDKNKYNNKNNYSCNMACSYGYINRLSNVIS